MAMSENEIVETVCIYISSDEEKELECEHSDGWICTAENITEVKGEHGENSAIGSELSHSDTPLVRQGKKRARKDCFLSPSVSEPDDSENGLAGFVVPSSHLSSDEGAISTSSLSASFTQLPPRRQKRPRRSFSVQERVESSDGANRTTATGPDDEGARKMLLEPPSSISTLPSVSELIRNINPNNMAQMSSPSTNSSSRAPSHQTPSPRELSPPSELSPLQLGDRIRAAESPNSSGPMHTAFKFPKTLGTDLSLSAMFKPTQISSPFTMPAGSDRDQSCGRSLISNPSSPIVAHSSEHYPSSPQLNTAVTMDSSSQYSTGLCSEDFMSALHAAESGDKAPSEELTNA